MLALALGGFPLMGKVAPTLGQQRTEAARYLACERRAAAADELWQQRQRLNGRERQQSGLSVGEVGIAGGVGRACGGRKRGDERYGNHPASADQIARDLFSFRIYIGRDAMCGQMIGLCQLDT